MIHPARPLLAAAALLTLAACSATHVGESWQCPLAQGAGCSTVAEADPALPRETAEAAPPPGAPLYRPRTSPGGAEPAAARSCGGDCEGGFDPFAWLAGLLRTMTGAEGGPASGRTEAGTGTGGSEVAVPASSTVPDAGAAQALSSVPLAAAATTPAASTGAGSSARLPAGLGTAGGAEAASATLVPPAPAAADAELREPEVIGRIWIAPFVDADGHYREGAWVRTVLDPAGWRAP